MSLLNAQGIELSYGPRKILQGVGLSLGPQDRLALVGANGCGKSTLLSILAGRREADGGAINKRKNLRISYLAQQGVSDPDATLRAELDLAFEAMHQNLRRIDALSVQVGEAGLAPEKLERLLEELHDLQEQLEHANYYQRDAQLERVAKGLGFSSQDLDKPCRAFSGGWQMRISLARILLESADVMLLDEPTNYLDLEARDWLAAWLKNLSGGTIVVSHDRWFMDEVATGIAEIYQGKLKVYPGSYSAYEAKRSLELEQVLAAYEKQQQEIAHLENFIRRFGAKNTKATQAQSRIKQLEKMERIEIPDGIRSLHFSFPPAARGSELALELRGVGRSYGQLKVLHNVDLEIKRGEHIAIVGPNGAGKSTLLRILAGVDSSFEGELKVGHNILRAWFSQDLETQLDDSRSVWEEAESALNGQTEQSLRNLLGSFLFEGDDIDKPVSVLSGGERNRLTLLKLLLKPSNVLILDEPTNHLDLTSKDVLLEALKKYEGTVLFVSHDRSFVEALAQDVIELRPEGQERGSRMLRAFGDWKHFTWKQQQEGVMQKLQTLEFRDGSAAKPGGLNASRAVGSAAQGSMSQAQREQDKERKAQQRRLEKQEAAILEQLEACEKEQSQLEHAMGTPAVYTKADELKRIKARLKELEDQARALQRQWEEVAIGLDALRGL